MWMRVGIRWASRTHSNVGLTFASSGRAPICPLLTLRQDPTYPPDGGTPDGIWGM
jgi:hypothetical protein